MPAAAKPKAVKDPLLGAAFARCKILGHVGQGRTATVYRAHYEPLDQEVAVKVLFPESSALQEIVSKFEQEARVLARIDNENVLKVYDVGQEDGRHFMVMELLEGEEILDLIEREEQVEPTDALRIVRQAANGLAAAHDKGLVHRDVKPQNLYLCEDGTVKVLDFGLATAHDASTERVGTPHYMAPEVCSHGQADLPSDIYGLGIVLFHLLTGQPPHAGLDVKGILRAHIAGEPLRPERHRPGLPKPVAELVRTLTKPDPLTRPSAPELVRLLDEMGGESLREKGSLRGRRSRRSSRARTAVARRERMEAKKKANPMLLVGLLGGAAAIGAIALLSSSGDDPSPQADTPAPPRTARADTPGTPGFITDVEDPAVTAAREKREQEAAARREAAAREREAGDALERAEAFARKWKSRADTAEILVRYRAVRDKFEGTDVAKALADRVRAIKKGDVHPHPDRTWDTEETVEQTRVTWTETKPKVQKLLASGDFEGALKALPPIVQDATGALAADLKHWHEYVRGARGMRRSIAHAFGARKPGAPKIMLQLEDGPTPIVKFVATGPSYRKGTKRNTLAWPEVSGAELWRLYEELIPDPSTEHALQALTVAHLYGLEDPFWNTMFTLDAAPDAAESADFRARLKANFRPK